MSQEEDVAYDFTIGSYEENVRVQERKPIREPSCWVFVRPCMSHDFYGNFSVNLEQAKLIKDSLSRWIDEVSSRYNLSD